MIGMALAILNDADLIVGEYTVNHGVQTDIHAVLPALLQQLFAQMDAADACAVVLGTEKLMDLLEQLTAGAVVFVKYHDLAAQLGDFQGCRQTCRASAHDCYLSLIDH